MPKPQAIARNADRNPNLNRRGVTSMKDKMKPKMAKMSTGNSIRDRNLKRMGKKMAKKGKMGNPSPKMGY